MFCRPAHWPAGLLLLALVLPMLAVACAADPEPTVEAPGASGAMATVTPENTPTRIPTATSRRGTPTPGPATIASATAAPAPTSTTPARPAAGGERPFASPEYGVQAFMWWRPEVGQRDLRLINELGFGWVKQGFAWRDIETVEKGAYDWWKPDKIVEQTEAAGLKLLVRLDRQPFWSQENPELPLSNAPPADLNDFGDFCGAIAERYQGRIHAYQVWNEPNLSREWGKQPPDPEAYTALLRVCAEAIRVADPEAIVISAGLAPTGTSSTEAMPDTTFLERMYEAGAAAYFDVLGLNAPGYKAPPEVSPAVAAAEARYGRGRWFAFRHVEDMRKIMLANGDAEKQVAILEMGWILEQNLHDTYTWHGVTEAQQAEYLVGAYEYAREHWQPWIGLMTAVYIADPDWTAEEDEQWWWAITLPDGSRRPAYEALREMRKEIGG